MFLILGAKINVGTFLDNWVSSVGSETLPDTLIKPVKSGTLPDTWRKPV